MHRELLLSPPPPPPPIKMASTAATSLPQMELHVLVGHTPRLVVRINVGKGSHCFLYPSPSLFFPSFSLSTKTSKAQNELVRQSKQAWDK